MLYFSDLEDYLKEHSIMISEDEHRSFVSWDEINSMPALSSDGKDSRISFGSYTVNHSILTNEKTNVVENEICKSKEIIEKECDRNMIYILPVNLINLYGIKCKYPIAFSQNMEILEKV
ncbi:MAG: hypothetical protein MAG551_02275 [Candidatus Scalindua arabica]|uniref:NodB homology domain-containing protein n=1 Tax=Candidatus Scalindua arabica TaxID=1127984 RepID=A0A941W4L4_9BACT|nr:hypothetical protein [Candidatus Scalindua arabica]